MKKQKINVIDLDKTLINYDTFRLLVLKEIRKGDGIVIYAVIMRLLKVYSSLKFKRRIQKYLVHKYPPSFFANYAKQVYKKLDKEVMEIVKHHSDTETINILLSASPNEYVRPLCELLNWKGTGSYFDAKNNFNHMHGIQKINWLKFFFPESNYIYHFAISDSHSDDELMGLFEEKMFWSFSN